MGVSLGWVNYKGRPARVIMQEGKTLYLEHIGPVKMDWDIEIEPYRLIDGEKLHAFLTKRYEALRAQVDRGFGGNLAGRNEAMRECKYWKEAIERGEFDL